MNTKLEMGFVGDCLSLLSETQLGYERGILGMLTPMAGSVWDGSLLGLGPGGHGSPQRGLPMAAWASLQCEHPRCSEVHIFMT